MTEQEIVTERKCMREREGKHARDRKGKQMGAGKCTYEKERKKGSMHKRGKRCNRKSKVKVPERGKARLKR